uniref:Putative ring finger protein ovary overexpressed n=1 Tax=Rhipicephalus microplus TaxID=6941 RepID=A0A6M2D0U5_RHIMP
MSSNRSDHWQLNDYERQRHHQKLIKDDTMVVPLHEDSFRRDFKCCICFGLLRNAVATTECLHRFCEECITKALRKCNKECPICRTRISSRRSLRRDHRMDILVASLVPHPAEEHVFETTRAAASKNRQVPKGAGHQDEIQVRERTAAAENALGRSSCCSETSREVDHSQEPMTVGGNEPAEEEASALYFSMSTLPQHRSPCGKPRRKSPTWPVNEGGNGFTCEETGPGLSLRIRANDTQSPKSGTCSGEYEVHAHDLVPTKSGNCPNRKSHGGGTVANSTDASCHGLCAALSDGLVVGEAERVVIALKPHLHMFLQLPNAPALTVNVSVETLIRNICRYVSEIVCLESPRRHGSAMHSLYGVSATGELIALPDTMTVKDAFKITKQSGAKKELYYAPR